MLSLVPGYMVVSWTVRLPAVGVRVTCGVEGWPEEGGENWGNEDKYTYIYIYGEMGRPHTSSPRRGLHRIVTYIMYRLYR